jgi:hypothetical protein
MVPVAMGCAAAECGPVGVLAEPPDRAGVSS